MMNERSFSLSFRQLVAYALVLLGLALIALNFRVSATNDHLGFAAIPPLALSMVLTVRGYMCEIAATVRATSALHQDAYAVGREVGRMEVEGGGFGD
jgi:hypothetical protein